MVVRLSTIRFETVLETHARAISVAYGHFKSESMTEHVCSNEKAYCKIERDDQLIASSLLLRPC